MDGTKRAMCKEVEGDCLQTELADADAEGSTQNMEVGTQSLFVCKHVEDKGLCLPLFCLLSSRLLLMITAQQLWCSSQHQPKHHAVCLT